MAAPKEYPVELRERATRMAVEARLVSVTRSGTFCRMGEQLGIHPEALWNWGRQVEIDGATVPALRPPMPSGSPSWGRKCASFAGELAPHAGFDFVALVALRI